MNGYQEAKKVLYEDIEKVNEVRSKQKILKVLLNYFAKCVDEGFLFESDIESLEKILTDAIGSDKAKNIIESFKKLYESNDEKLKKSVKKSLLSARRKVDKKLKEEESKLTIYKNLLNSIGETSFTKVLNESEEDVITKMLIEGRIQDQRKKAEKYKNELSILLLKANEKINKNRVDLELYGLISLTQKYLDDIKTYLDVRDVSYALLTDELLSEFGVDFKKMSELIEKAKQYFEEHKEKEFTPNYNDSVLIFLKNNETGEEYLEEDLKNNPNIKSHNDTLIVLKTAIGKTDDEWRISLQVKGGYKRNITETKANGKKGDKITIISDYSGTEYDYFRLKDDGKTNARVLAFDINVCDENRKKLKLPKDKHVILILGEIDVTKFSNETTDDIPAKSKLNSRSIYIKKYIKLFEDPNTKEEVLREIILDSQKYYEDLLKEKKRSKN